MKFEKFKSIIKYNLEHTKDTSEYIKIFYSEMGLSYDSDVLNLMQIMRTMLQNKEYLLIEIPFKDKEIGALCYKGVSKGYIFLNSALPKVNVNFALCHEIYHIFFQKRPMKHAIELYMNEHYFNDEEEFAANAFAGALIMPELNFKKMYHKFQSEMNEEDTEISIIARLMNYYEAPFMGVLIRSYELELIKDAEILEKLLKTDLEMIKSEFARLWLNECILEPDYRDDFSKFELLVKQSGENMQSEEILSEEIVKKALVNMRKIYGKIREG